MDRHALQGNTHSPGHRGALSPDTCRPSCLTPVKSQQSHFLAVTVTARCSSPLPLGPLGTEADAEAGEMTDPQGTPAPPGSQATTTNQQQQLSKCRVCPAPMGDPVLACLAPPQQSWGALPRHPGLQSHRAPCLLRKPTGPQPLSPSSSDQASAPPRGHPWAPDALRWGTSNPGTAKHLDSGWPACGLTRSCGFYFSTRKQ